MCVGAYYNDMKVLVITSLLHEKSGLGRYARAVIDHMRLAGVEVVVCSEEMRTDVAYPVVPLRPLTSRFPLVSFLRNCYRVRRAARGCTVVHALDGWPLCVYAAVAGVGNTRQVFSNGIGTYSVAPLYVAGKSLLLRWAYRRAQKIFCISAYVRQRLVDAGVVPEKLSVVHLGATVLPTPSSTEVRECLQRYDLSTTAKIILTVGAIKSRKGQLVTLQAVELLKKKYPDICYVAAGASNTASYVARMRDYAAAHHLVDNLRIIENADDTTIACLYAASSVFALNSYTNHASHHFEGFGMVVIEAAQFGVPAVGSRGCGIEDAILDGETGYLTEQENPQDIANKIGRVLEQRDTFSQNALRWHAQFTWEKTVAAYIAAYRAASVDAV